MSAVTKSRSHKQFFKKITPHIESLGRLCPHWMASGVQRLSKHNLKNTTQTCMTTLLPKKTEKVAIMGARKIIDQTNNLHGSPYLHVFLHEYWGCYIIQIYCFTSRGILFLSIGEFCPK